MKKIFFAILLLVFLASCAKDPMPDENALVPATCHRTRFSVLGESYSAFEGSVDPETNAIFHYSEIGITKPEQMWFYQVAKANNWELEKNNSFSGSMVCNCKNNEYHAPHSFIRRMDNLGNPDVIFVFGATNDVFYEAPLGEFVYSDWTEEQLEMFRPGLAYLLYSLGELYPHAKLFLMIDMDLCSGGVEESVRDSYIRSMHAIANYYQVKCIDLYRIRKDLWHPDVHGMHSIAIQVIESTKKNSAFESILNL